MIRVSLPAGVCPVGGSCGDFGVLVSKQSE